MSYQSYKSYKKNLEQRTVESILRGIGWLLKLPFRRWLVKNRYSTIDQNDVQRRWQTIEQLAESDDPHNLSQAIILADKLLDAVLQARGLSGVTMADRLKAAKDLYSDYSVYQGAWDAHKLRNQIAHELNLSLDPSAVRQNLEKLKKAIFSLI